MATPEPVRGPVPVEAAPAQPGKEAQPDQKAARVSPYPGQETVLPVALAKPLRELEKLIEQPLILIVQDTANATSGCAQSFDNHVRDACTMALKGCEPKRPVTVLLHSAGGQADAAFQAARCIQRHCGSFSVIVPRYAKSAATLFALGASKIYLNDVGELGPLDVQLFDVDQERYASGLDEVQSLERLHSQALSMLDSTMQLLVRRTGKRTDVLLPHTINYVTHFMRPLLEKIDAVHYTATARLLRVAEMYAVRLMEGAGYSSEHAEQSAADLTHGYPEHGFAVDIGEAERVGLRVESVPDAQKELLGQIMQVLEPLPLVGRLT